jgi:hypothetical protein
MNSMKRYDREKRLTWRRQDERRALFERRVINASALFFYETRFIPDRRQGERREGDRRHGNA